MRTSRSSSAINTTCTRLDDESASTLLCHESAPDRFSSAICMRRGESQT